MDKERKLVQFVHYETKEVREVAEPTKLQQYGRDFITAFMTSEEHYQDLPWYREMVAAILEEIKAENGGKQTNNDYIKAFPLVRIEFVKKYFPEHAPKAKTPRKRKPAKIDMWNL